MSTKGLVGIFVGLVVLLVVFSSAFTVTQGHEAILLRLGDIVKNKQGEPKVLKPGLHFKLPFLMTVRDFDVRLQSFSVESSRILTAEQKYVLVDYYTKWRIDNLALYYKRTGGFDERAKMLIKQKINDALRAAFGKRDIKDAISNERMDIMDILRKKARQSAENLGLEVVDVRIKGIELPQQVRESVFERMRTEREQVATFHRSQGRASAESLRADADAKVAIEVAAAKTKAAETRAAGDKKAAIIYAAAYDQDAKFYAFYRSLLAYQDVFANHGTVMVLKPQGQFFKYFLPNNSKSH